MSPRIHILLPVHNRRETTRRFVECLRAQRFQNYHLVLIDDGSTDGTAAMVAELVPEVTVIRGDGTWWWAGSLQNGLDVLRSLPPDDEDIVLFINDDVQFDVGYLEAAVRVMNRHKNSMVLSQFKDVQTNEARESGVCADLRRLTFEVATAPERINCLSTRGLFVRWADVRRIGDFFPRLLPHYLADYEYTMRGHRKGLACVTSDELLLIVDTNATGWHEFGDLGFRAFCVRYFSRRSAANPLYWTSFILLAVPFPWKVINLARVWRGAMARMLRKAWSSAW